MCRPCKKGSTVEMLYAVREASLSLLTLTSPRMLVLLVLALLSAGAGAGAGAAHDAQGHSS